ncbi:MAG: tetratricopeptide repeat protein, partial [candidate division Zixibacteria bacterium]|nr:tetratricopeptide repeat protein [candidate division Zixibacteria bacterium]
KRKTVGAGNFSPTVRFLAILSGSTLAAVFLFDPKLGMPRDWDLFSFAAIPVTVLFYFLVLKSKHGFPFSVKIASLAIALSLLMLAPRIYASKDEQVALRRIESFIELDTKKNRTAMQLLQNFHAERRNITAVAAIVKRYTKMYPEVALTHRAAKLGSSGQDGQGGPIDSALTLLHQALDINPMYAPAYLNLGRAFRALNNFDSALYYLEIADGLNPYNKFIIAELGQVYQELGDMYLREGKLKRAREWFRRAVEMDSSLLAR